MSHPDDSVASAFAIARRTYQGQAPEVLVTGQSSSLCLLCIDRSGSMDIHGDTPRLAVNEMIQTLQSAPGREQAMLAVLAFNDQVQMLIPPTPVLNVRPVSAYRAMGATKLYGVTDLALRIGLEFRGFASSQYGADLRVAVCVISDGKDNVSAHMHDSVLERASAARKCGFDLQAIGIGIDSERLARDLGFDPSFAYQVDASAQGVVDAVRRTSRTFSTTMLGRAAIDPHDPRRDTPV